MIELEVVSNERVEEMNELREAYMKGLPYAQDLNIEENIWISEYDRILVNHRLAGYACIDAGKTLWEFYLIDTALTYAQDIFYYLINRNYIAAAECKTYDHLLLSLCMDYQKKAEGSAYLYRDYIECDIAFEGQNQVIMRLATDQDYDMLSKIDIIAEGIEFFYDLKKEISKGEVFIFLLENQLLGAGTCKEVWKGMPYRELGMVVDEKHRKKGLGTFILVKMREYCVHNNLLPVCGCYYYHSSSKKTLEKAGFISKHRVIRFSF